MFWKILILCLSVVHLASAADTSKGEDQSAFTFGAIADCQYCAVPGKGVRKYALSEKKLTKCVAHLNTIPLEFTVHLGDFIDRDFKSFDVVNPVFAQLNMPRYHVLGNHDFSVADELKEKVPGKMGLSSRYYTFTVKGWRFVVLDGNDISFYAYPKDSAAYVAAQAYYKNNQLKAPRWNGAIGPKQQAWLRTVLENAEQKKERVMLFCHFPIFPENSHNLWNAEEIVTLLEAYPCVKAYVNGHNHKGHYAVKEGIHYLTLKGMVDTEQTSYAVISVDEQGLSVKGYGREKDRYLLLKK